MANTAVSDYKQKNAGAGAIFADASVFIRAVNNNAGGLAYVSTTSTDANGLYTIAGAPPGSYALFSGPTAVGPWTATGDTNYIIPINPDDPTTLSLVGNLIIGAGQYNSISLSGAPNPGQYVTIAPVGLDLNIQLNLQGKGTQGVVIPYMDGNPNAPGASGLYMNAVKTGQVPASGNQALFVGVSAGAVTPFQYIYDVAHDFNVGIGITVWAANGTGITATVHTQGDAMFFQTDDTAIPVPLTPPNALNIWAGAGNASQPTDSGSGGTVTYTANTITDTAKAWTVNQWANNGSGVGRWVIVGAARMLITSNTGTVATGTGGWVTMNVNNQMVATATPAAGAAYAFPQPNGTGVNIQRFGSGPAVRINGQPGSGSLVGNASALTQLVDITQNVNGRTILENDFGTTTADTWAITVTAKTSGIIFNLFHGGSVFTGTGISMNFASGSGSFSGSYIALSLNSVPKFGVGSDGSVFMASGTKIDTYTAGPFSIGSSTATTITIGRVGQQISLLGQTAIGNASANYMQITGVAGGSAPSLAAQGSDANVGLILIVKATSAVFIQSSTLANYLQLNPAATGVGPSLQVAGSDPNINVRLIPQGTGIVDLVYATTALGGGAAPTLGTIGGTGPTAAAQNSWLKVRINGVDSWIPVWR